jgi:hypothetical protein
MFSAFLAILNFQQPFQNEENTYQLLFLGKVEQA